MGRPPWDRRKTASMEDCRPAKLVGHGVAAVNYCRARNFRARLPSATSSKWETGKHEKGRNAFAWDIAMTVNMSDRMLISYWIRR